jgi:hypothetical protein
VNRRSFLAALLPRASERRYARLLSKVTPRSLDVTAQVVRRNGRAAGKVLDSAARLNLSPFEVQR